jgi:ABC-type molybdate transport system substrate-binding protein
VRRPADLARATEAPIYLADPACPLGRYTDEFLRANRLHKPLKPRIRLVGNSRAVVAALRTAENALGVIFGSDEGQAAGLATLLSVPASQVKAECQGAVIATSGAVDEARELLAFLASLEGMRCFRRCGFQA